MLTSLVLVLNLATSSSASQAPVVPGSVALSEPGRYQSRRTYEDTLEYYQRVFKHKDVVKWKTIANLPGIRAKHIASLRKSTAWEGINIYEYKGKVRFYIIPRDKHRP